MSSPKNATSVLLNNIRLKKAFFFILPALMLTAIFAYAAGEFWEKKAYFEWTQKECQKLLENSPWAKEYTQTGVQSIGSLTGGDATDNQAPYVKYIIQLRSAKPIRQAIVRQTQILRKYETLPDDQKQALDKNSQNFLDEYPSDLVIVHMIYSCNSNQTDRDLARHWQSQTVDLLKNSVFLSGSKGEKVPIARFMVTQGAEREFDFVFPRQVNGKEILSPEDKSLRLEFTYPVVRGIGDGRGFIEFKLDKMKIQGELVY
jgi:hypothetical protein